MVKKILTSAQIEGEMEEVLSFKKAVVYCWRACIYFTAPQIVARA